MKNRKLFIVKKRPMRHTLSSRDSTMVVKAASVVGSTIGKSASVFVSLTALAYYLGWSDLSQYCASLGAPWMFTMIPTLDYLSSGAALVAILIFFGWMTVSYIGRWEHGHQTIARFRRYLLFAAVAFSFPLVLPEYQAFAFVQWSVVSFAALLFVVSSGMGVGDVTVEIMRADYKWTLKSATEMYGAAVIGIFCAPLIYGSARAKLDLIADAERLVEVRSTALVSTHSWRLVRVVGDSAVLIADPVNATGNVFRVVDSKILDEIKGVRR